MAFKIMFIVGFKIYFYFYITGCINAYMTTLQKTQFFRIFVAI